MVPRILGRGVKVVISLAALQYTPWVYTHCQSLQIHAAVLWKWGVSEYTWSKFDFLANAVVSLLDGWGPSPILFLHLCE